LHNAKYNITFNCNDTAGNTNTSIRYFTVNDTTLPTFIDVNETTIAKTFFRVHWEANEPVNATIRYGTTLSLNSNVTNSTFANETTQQISGLNDDTEYFWNFTGCDYMGNCRTVGPFNVTTLLNESAGGNEPGEGGGGGTVSNQTNQTSKTQLWAMLEAGSTTTMNIDSPNIPVTGIEFRIASDVENGQITVRGLGNTPPAGLPAPPDTVYQFFSIDATSNLDAALTSATITFTVPSSYFTQNNQNASTARLYNSNATHWEMLGTVRDGNTYEATTTHFSFFAITSKPNEGVVLPSGNETVPNETTELPSDELEDVFVPPSAGPLELPLDYVIYIVIMSVGIAVVAVLIYLVKTERIHLKLPKPKEKPGKPLPQKQQDYLRIKKLNKRRPPRGEGPGIFKLE
jgi:PGF-pre-PGF domain-containing protein